ncbi:MAG: LysR family transcriptional regulator [Oscillospiraceae bacterium]|nr:LysR family transcriptional regulator [Oscillospiraceae bacterium]
MTDSQRNCFLAVAEHRSFSKAATALYVSQPAVSKNISTLEEELGTSLFDRQGKLVELTKAGEIFFMFLMEYRREYENMMERIRSLDSGTLYGVVRIGCVLTWNAAHFYTRLSRHFAIHFPGVKLEVIGLEPEAIIPALRRKEIDFAIMYNYEDVRQQDIDARQFIDLGAGFLCSGLIAGNERLTPENIAGFPFLITENLTDRHTSTYRDIIRDMLRKHGVSPEFMVCRSLSSAMVDLSCGKGVLMADDWTAAKSNSELRYIPSGETIPLCLAYLRSNRDSLVSLTMDETLRVFKGNL